MQACGQQYWILSRVTYESYIVANLLIFKNPFEKNVILPFYIVWCYKRQITCVQISAPYYLRFLPMMRFKSSFYLDVYEFVGFWRSKNIL